MIKVAIIFAFIAGCASRFLLLFDWRERHPPAEGAGYAKVAASVPTPKPSAFAVDAQKQREMNSVQSRPQIKLNQWNRCCSV